MPLRILVNDEFLQRDGTEDQAFQLGLLKSRSDTRFKGGGIIMLSRSR